MPLMINVTIYSDDKSIQKIYKEKLLLSDALKDASVALPFYCSGKGLCGKCKIKAAGELSEITQSEREHLTADELGDGIRLACMTYALGDCEIFCDSADREFKILSSGYMPDFKRDAGDGYGIAIDIGTTTVAAYVCDLKSGEICDAFGAPNPQSVFGADVISRINAALGGSAETLRSLICSLTDELKKRSGKSISKTVITGNTTMLYLLFGYDVSDLAAAPFEAKHLFGEDVGDMYICPCVSSYVGADFVSAVLSSDMTKDEASFLVDIGTNGEMAFYHKGRLLCCSTAAGPALEGAQIKYGMPALDGAINKVYIKENKLAYTSIGGAKPTGICGSGIIDAVSCLKTLGLIDESGYLEDDVEIGDSQIFITPNDIRQVQLAKSAIRSGINTLLHESGAQASDIEKFYIAGGFGSYLDKESCANIGLIPKEVTDRVIVLGNGAGSGAVMALTSKEKRDAGEITARSAQVTELTANPYFTEEYMENMMF